MSRDAKRAGRPSRPTLAVLAAGTLLLGACQSGGYEPPTSSLGGVGVGTAGGAAAGGLLGRAIAGRHDNTLALLGGALLGGVAGNILVDRPGEVRSRTEAEMARDRELQRKLDYERQSELQREQVRREIEEQRLYEEWKQQRSAGLTGTTAAPTLGNAPADVMAAQRLLTALGYYRGAIDGVYGPGTRSAVMQFESAQGLPQTGTVTPALLSRMRTSLLG